MNKNNQFCSKIKDAFSLVPIKKNKKNYNKCNYKLNIYEFN